MPAMEYPICTDLYSTCGSITKAAYGLNMWVGMTNTETLAINTWGKSHKDIFIIIRNKQYNCFGRYTFMMVVDQCMWCWILCRFYLKTGGKINLTLFLGMAWGWAFCSRTLSPVDYVSSYLHLFTWWPWEFHRSRGLTGWKTNVIFLPVPQVKSLTSRLKFNLKYLRMPVSEVIIPSCTRVQMTRITGFQPVH